ncbi:MAG: hypothetical protein KJN76_09135 [Eudoraea sp.]|nr:hypothetical protein [Eudoraea sp.]
MRKLLFFCLFSFCYSCIPLKVAPQINDYRVTAGSKFSKTLSDRTMFLFEDPKVAGEFYSYVNTRFQLNGLNVYDDVPFLIDGDQYFFAFYEVVIDDKILNLFPAILFAALESEDGGYESGDEVLRRENWYVAIEVYSDLQQDCLEVDSLSREVVLEYLSALKGEYLSTDNYNEFVLKD